MFLSPSLYFPTHFVAISRRSSGFFFQGVRGASSLGGRRSARDVFSVFSSKSHRLKCVCTFHRLFLAMPTFFPACASVFSSLVWFLLFVLRFLFPLVGGGTEGAPLVLGSKGCFLTLDLTLARSAITNQLLARFLYNFLVSCIFYGGESTFYVTIRYGIPTMSPPLFYV